MLNFQEKSQVLYIHSSFFIVSYVGQFYYYQGFDPLSIPYCVTIGSSLNLSVSQLLHM